MLVYWLIIVLLAILLVMDGDAAIKNYKQTKKVGQLIFRMILLLALFLMIANYVAMMLTQGYDLQFIFK